MSERDIVSWTNIICKIYDFFYGLTYDLFKRMIYEETKTQQFSTRIQFIWIDYV